MLAGLLAILFGCSGSAVRTGEAAAVSGGSTPAAAAPKSAAGGGEIPKSREALVQKLLAAGDEWFGLYVLGKKTGVMSTSAARETRDGRDVLVVRSETELQAAVGSRKIQRKVIGERVYELAGSGRLLSLREEKQGDGGGEILVGTCRGDGLEIVRTPQGGKPESRLLPPTGENLDAALAAGKVLEDGAVRPRSTSASAFRTTRHACCL